MEARQRAVKMGTSVEWVGSSPVVAIYRKANPIERHPDRLLFLPSNKKRAINLGTIVVPAPLSLSLSSRQNMGGSPLVGPIGLAPLSPSPKT